MRMGSWMAAFGLAITCLAAPAFAKDDLVIGVSNFPSSMNPYLDPEVVKTYIEDFATRPVTAFDKDWNLGCLLCTELPSIENGLAKIEDRPSGGKGMAVTIKLKPNLKWGDGVPVTSADIAFTAKVGRDPASGFADTRLWGRVTSVDVPDPLTAVLHLDGITSEFDRISMLLPEHIEGPVYAKAGTPGAYINATVYNRAPTTPGLWNGPWMVTDYTSGSQVVLSVNPYWAGKPPAFKHIVIRTIENTAALQANPLSGDIDMAPGESIGLTIDQVLALRKQSPDRFTYIFKPSLTYDLIALNLDNPILADVRVRRALLMGIDRKTMGNRLFEGLLPIASTWVNPLEPNFDKAVPVVGYDPAGAKALLTEAGWTPGADGICRNANGDRLSLEFTVTAGNRLRELQQTVMQSDWRKLCIDTVLKNEPFRTMFGASLKHRTFRAMVLFSWISGVDQSPRQTLATNQIPSQANNWAGSNFFDFSNADFDRGIATLETELDPAQRKAASAAMQHIYADQLPALPLFFRSDAHVIPTWLKGYEPTGYGDYGVLHAEDWYQQP